MIQYTPREYQELIWKHIVGHKRCAIWASMGMGKTSAALYAISMLTLVENIKPLILAPLRVARDVWPAETNKWSFASGMKCSPIIGSAEERLEALNTKADIYTINYENIPWLFEQVKNKWPWNAVISDESTKLKSFRLRQGGQRAKILSQVAFSKVDRFVELTGTPSPNGLLDLWGQFWFLDKGERLGRTYTSYRNAFFRLLHERSRQYILMPYMDKTIHRKVQDLCLSVQAEDWFDLQKPVYNKINAYLPGNCRAMYRKLERDMFLKLQEVEINAVNAAALSMKCLQFANGAMYTDESKNWIDVHTEKLLVLQEIIESHAGENIIVAYNFKSDLARLKKFFSYGVSIKDKKYSNEKWNAGQIPLLFLHPASAGHGLNLQDGGRIIVFFGLTWNLEYRLQTIERIGPVRQLQSGHNRVVYIYDICTAGTVDELVIQSNRTKKPVQDALLDAAKKGMKR